MRVTNIFTRQNANNSRAQFSKIKNTLDLQGVSDHRTAPGTTRPYLAVPDAAALMNYNFIFGTLNVPMRNLIQYMGDIAIMPKCVKIDNW